MESGFRDVGAGEMDGIEHGVGGDDTGTSHVDLYGAEDRFLLFRGEFIGDSPFRSVYVFSESRSFAQQVGFYYRSVDIVSYASAAFADIGDSFFYFFSVGKYGMFDYREPERRQESEPFAVT